MPSLKVGSGEPFEERYGYSRAVRVGNLVFVAGTTARGEALGQGAHAQAASALEVIEQALAEAGAGFADVVRTVVYIIDWADLEDVARAHRGAFGPAAPAATLVQVSGLTPSAARVEIEVTAVVRESRSSGSTL
jgi:enamine deaminase RidA (YjgF/YER057c/UK114 family)